MRYERLVAKALPRAAHGQWFHFIDSNGPGWCQPDVLLLGQKSLLVLECKLTYTPEAVHQLSKLYLPVLAAAYPQHFVAGGIVCKNLTPDVPLGLLVESLRELTIGASPSTFPILHWLGHGPIA